MKKRLLSTLLILCLVTALFSGLSVTASADNETIQHTLKRGETVIGVCKTLGIDFYANYKWITETNKITNYGNLKPDMVLTLPKPGTRPSLVPGNQPAAQPGNPAPNPGGAVLPGGTPGLKLQGQDFVTGYLITHIMQRGETISGVCNSLGINFTQNSATIQKLNNIQNYNKIYAGRAIVLPSPNAPASGSCIAVVAHKVVKGDAMYNVCNSYGIDYASNLKMIQNMNGRTDNFTKIQVGQLIYLPIPTVVAPSGGNGNGGNVPGGNGGGSVQPNVPGGNGGNTQPSGKVYTIKKLTTNHGSFEVPSSAAAGTTVSVKTNPAWTYQTGTIKVTCNGKNVPVNDGKFVMPEGNVKVSVSFISEKTNTIYRGPEKNGRFNTSVNGNITDKAVHTQIVHVNTEAVYGYELDKITVSYNSGKSFVPLRSDGCSFEMPDHAVKVDVSFKQSKAHAINFSVSNGSADAKINGRIVKEAHSGETIKIACNPDSGFKLAGIAVVSGGYNVPVNGNSFIMPAGPVDITVKFAKDVYRVNIEQPANGTLSVSHTAAEAGTTVTVTATPAANYAVSKVTVNGTPVAISGVTGSFQMPVGDVTVRAEFVAQKKSVAVYQNGNGESSSSNANPGYGETVTITAKPAKGWELDSITATTASGKNVAVNNGSFQMPAENVNVNVNFKAVKFNVNVVSVPNGTVSVNKTSAVWTEEVAITANPYAKGEIESITVTDANGNNVPVDSNNKFKMPCSDATVKVTFRSIKSYSISRFPSAGGDFKIQIDGLDVSEAKAGQLVNLVISPEYGYKLESITVTNGEGKNVPVNGTSFVMPSSIVSISVKFAVNA